MMDWVGEEDKECQHNFGCDMTLKGATWKSEKEMEGKNQDGSKCDGL
jgi:hypothetical protein